MAEITIGTRVVKSGYPGIVTGIYEWNNTLVEVKLATGSLVTSRATFDGSIGNCYIVEETEIDPAAPPTAQEELEAEQEAEHDEMWNM